MPDEPARKAIGVFDSGVGGLTVFQALAQRLPDEPIVYLGDTARVPYGTKSPEAVTRYALNCAALLVQRGIKLLVVACNTASAYGLEALRERLPLPVVGVIEPGARSAADATQTGRIGVIGTAGSIGSGAYQEALVRYAPGAQVFCRACPLFVPLAEEGWTTGAVPLEAARTYLEPLREEGIDTLLLGCTHYPILRAVIAEAIGEGVQLVDSACSTAAAVEEMLEAMDLRCPAGQVQDTRHAFLVTDDPSRFAATARHFLGGGLVFAEWVNL